MMLAHFLIAEPGWEEVADCAIEWASAQARATASERGRMPRLVARLPLPHNAT